MAFVLLLSGLLLPHQGPRVVPKGHREFFLGGLYANAAGLPAGARGPGRRGRVSASGRVRGAADGDTAGQPQIPAFVARRAGPRAALGKEGLGASGSPRLGDKVEDRDRQDGSHDRAHHKHCERNMEWHMRGLRRSVCARRSAAGGQAGRVPCVAGLHARRLRCASPHALV